MVSCIKMMPEMDWDDMEYQRDMDRNLQEKCIHRHGNMGSGSSSMKRRISSAVLWVRR